MKSEEGMYYSPLEFAILLELSEGSDYTLCGVGEETDEAALAGTLEGLYRRGLLRSEGEQLVPDGEAEVFAAMRNAPYTVSLWAGGRDRGLCYTGRNRIFLIEPGSLPPPQFRLREMTLPEMEVWLSDADLLPQPLLTEEVAEPLARLFPEDLESPEGEVLMRLEKYRNGGGFVHTVELVRGRGGRLLVFRDGMTIRAGYQTAERQRELLKLCFLEE